MILKNCIKAIPQSSLGYLLVIELFRFPFVRNVCIKPCMHTLPVGADFGVMVVVDHCDCKEKKKQFSLIFELTSRCQTVVKRIHSMPGGDEIENSYNETLAG